VQLQNELAWQVIDRAELQVEAQVSAKVRALLRNRCSLPATRLYWDNTANPIAAQIRAQR
jgi:hypothetical protein